jgi:hypothetical protein
MCNDGNRKEVQNLEDEKEINETISKKLEKINVLDNIIQRIKMSIINEKR